MTNHEIDYQALSALRHAESAEARARTAEARVRELENELKEVRSVIQRASDRVAYESRPDRSDWTSEKSERAVDYLIRDVNHIICWCTDSELSALQVDYSLLEDRVGELEKDANKP